MDKRIVYAGAIPVDLDWLEPQRNAEYALGYVMQAAFGTSTLVDGLAVTQQASPNMTVQVGPGSVISYTTVDPTGVAYGALSLDNNNLVKIGVNKSATNMSALTAPGVAGQSQNWLLEAKFLEADGSAVVLPYYNASNPSLPYTGPGGLGTSQTTRRTNTVQFQWKSGTAATTGTQVTPSPDSGWVGIAVVTVANGQATITNANIAPYIATPTVPTKLPAQRKKLTANLNLFVATTGSDSNSGLASWDAFATVQKAWTTLVNGYDLSGFSVTVSVANGTYTGGLVASGLIPGLGSGNTVSFVGNVGSPSSCVISTSGAHAISVQNGALISVSGFSLAASGTTNGIPACCLVAFTASQVAVAGAMVFGAAAGQHMFASVGSTINVSSISYTVNGAAQTHFIASTGGYLNIFGCTITVSGTPAFGTGFAVASMSGTVQIGSTTFTGSATGNKFAANTNGVINTGGAALAYFPGSVTPSLPQPSGGQYV